MPHPLKKSELSSPIQVLNYSTSAVIAPSTVIATILPARIDASTPSKSFSTYDDKTTEHIPIHVSQKAPETKAVYDTPTNLPHILMKTDKGNKYECGTEANLDAKKIYDSPQETMNLATLVTQDSKIESDKMESSSGSKDGIANISLLSAQATMFDPKYMYKEYNLRRTKKQELLSQKQEMSSQKKSKGPESVGKETNSSISENQSKVDDKPSLQQSVKRKRGRPRKECKEEFPAIKKAKEDKISNVVTQTTESECVIPDSLDCGQPTVKTGLKLSLPRTSRSSSSSLSYQVIVESPLSKGLKETPTQKENNGQENSINVEYKKRQFSLSAGMHQTIQASSFQNRSKLTCALCKERGGVSGLGFLFGPYRHHPALEFTESVCEVWVHEDCCVWAPGVCLVGRELKGLRDALTDGNKMVR